MNRPIVRLYRLVVVLFALLVGFTSRWTIFQASALRANPLNHARSSSRSGSRAGASWPPTGPCSARSVRTREGNYERATRPAKSSRNAIGYSYL